MLHLGLLITKDDDEIIEEWFFDNGHFFDGIACLDGSRSERTRRAAGCPANVSYLHEDQFQPLDRTDHGLRAVVHQALVQRYGPNGWITLCHADEFFYHDPRRCCAIADEEGSDGIAWYAVHFLPHPNDLAHWSELRDQPPQKRFRYYHWDFNGNGQPWLEFRSYRNSTKIRWDSLRHGSTQPEGCSHVAAFHPAYRHYKVYTIDPHWYLTDGARTLFRHHWTETPEGRTGVPWPASRSEDLFVAQYQPYRRCDYFKGSFDHGWNIGEEYR